MVFLKRKTLNNIVLSFQIFWKIEQGVSTVLDLEFVAYIFSHKAKQMYTNENYSINQSNLGDLFVCHILIHKYSNDESWK